MTALSPQLINIKIKHLHLHKHFRDTGTRTCTYIEHRQSAHIKKTEGEWKKVSVAVTKRNETGKSVGGKSVGVHTYIPLSPHPSISVHLFFPLGLVKRDRITYTKDTLHV